MLSYFDTSLLYSLNSLLAFTRTPCLDSVLSTLR